MDKYHNYRKKTGKGWKNIPSSKIIAWIESNFEYRVRKNGEEYTICDPFTGDSKFKFNINPENGVCHSWHGDEWAGPVNPKTGRRNCSVINFVKTYRRCSYREALSEILGENEISEYMKFDSRVNESAEEKRLVAVLPAGVELLSSSIDRQALSLIKWLKSRGYTDKNIEKAELYHLGMDVYWPYFEFEELVYWQSRSRLNKRFEFPPEEIYNKDGEVVGKTIGTKGDYLYGFDNIEMASYIIITEAIFDQNTLGEQCLASGGCDLTVNQINKIKLLGPKKGIILSPDNDDAGIGSIVRNKQMLESLNIPMFYSLPPKMKYEQNGKIFYTKDWNEIGQHVTGYDNIRRLHDEGIKKITFKEVIRLKNMLSKGTHK